MHFAARKEFELTVKTVLGIDPGTIVAGYAVIAEQGDREVLLEADVLKLTTIGRSKGNDIAQRLVELFDCVGALIERFKPEAVSLESSFYGKNAQAALRIGQARAAVILASEKKGVPVFEYAPKAAKKALTGSGSASKEEVAKMARLIFGLGDETQLPLDATDAVAIAFAHVRTRGFGPLGT